MDFPSIRAASELIQRAMLAARSGMSFGDKRDIYAALGYKRALTIDDFRMRYFRGGIAARIVDVYPRSTWRNGAELIEDEDPKVITEFEKNWNDLNRRLRVWSIFCRADILAGLGKYATILIGVPGSLDKEISQMRGIEDVLYLAPYAEDEMKVSTLVDDPQDARFGLPKSYKLNLRTVLGSGTEANIEKEVHWSRVIHVADGILSDPIYGVPRLERVWNYLDDLEKVVGGGSEAFWLRVHQGLFFEIDPEAEISDGQIAEMKDKADDFANNLRRTIAMRGTKMKALGSDVSDFGNQVTSLMALIAGTSGTPQRLLLGSERGELASTQDKENWDARVSDRRNGFADPAVRQLVDRFIQYGALSNAEYEVRWPDMEDLNEQDRAVIAVRWAGLNQAAGGTVVTPAEIRDRVLRLDPLDSGDEMEQFKFHPPTQALDPVTDGPGGPPMKVKVLPHTPGKQKRRLAAADGPKAGLPFNELLTEPEVASQE